MEAFATVQQLEARWRTLTADEQPRAEVLLSDAASVILSMCAKSGVTVDDGDEQQAYSLQRISCEMVKRAMLSPIDQAPLNQWSQSAGGYSESQSFANPSGDLYMLSAEKSQLGIGKQHVGSLAPRVAALEANDD